MAQRLLLNLHIVIMYISITDSVHLNQSFLSHFYGTQFTCTYIEQCGGMVEGDCTVPLIYVLSYGYVDNHLIACIP